MINVLLEVMGTFGVMILYSVFTLAIMLLIQTIVFVTTKFSIYNFLKKL